MKQNGITAQPRIACLAVVATCLAFSAVRASAQTVYFSDDFEQGLGRWTVAGDTWQVTDLFCHSGGRCASDSPQGDYPANANSIMAMKIQYRMNLSTSTRPVLSFWHRISVWLGGGDYGYVDVSTDNGLTWSELASFTKTKRSTWSREQFDLSAYRSSSVLIRFRLRADDNNNRSSGWDIDDVEIREADTTTLPFPLLDDFESGLYNWTCGSWQLTELASHSSTQCIADNGDALYAANACSDMILAHPIDLSSSVSPILAFWHRISVWPGGGDYGYVDVSTDNGLTWTGLASFTRTKRSTWSREQFDLSAYKSSRVLIRFRLRADDNNNRSSGWSIDDLEIRELDTETLAFPLFDDFESGTTNWVFGGWQQTQSDFRSSTHSMTDSNDALYPANACSDMILAHPIDLSSSVLPVLAFWHRIGLWSGGGDYAYVEASQDNGFTWQAIDPNYPELSTFTRLSYSTWTPELLDLSPYRSSSVLIRFRLRADDNNNRSSGWDIDDVEIKELIPPDLYVEMTGLAVTECPTVQATVIVADMHGEAVTGLPESAFSVYEDGVPQAATVVESVSEIASTSLVLDFSGSMSTQAILDLQRAAEQFVNLMRPGDSAEVIKFAKGIEVAQSSTLDQGALITAIWSPTSVDRSETALYDAVCGAIANVVTQEGGRSKAVLAMTDGQDNASTEGSATKAIKLAKQNGVRVFTIGLGDQVDEDALKAIATLTGGVYYYAPTSADLESIYQAIAGAIQNQYIVTYETSACVCGEDTGTEHEVMITVAAPAGSGLDTERFRCPTGPTAAPTTVVAPGASIQDAIDAASDGDAIEVAPGSYHERINFKGKAIRLYGGDGAEFTTIDGDGVGPVVLCISGEDARTILEGFTITGGKASDGGGMYNVSSSPTIADCVFQDNVADSRGGGMYNNGGHPTVTNCTFSANLAPNEDGGGMANDNSSPRVTTCTFVQNSAGDGGGGMHNRSQSHPTITGCTFDENQAEDGGGMQNFSDCSPVITECTFRNNLALNGNGGGIDNTYSGNATITHCVFTANTATYGGAILSGWNSSPTVANCVCFGNSATWGGASYNIDNSTPTVTNCTFSQNSAQNNGGGAYAQDCDIIITNCVVWGNTPNSITGSAVVTYSDVEGGWAGQGNLNADPRLVGGGDCHLKAGSPCLNAGSDAAVSSSTDLDGNARIQGSAVDMGAFEESV